MSNVRRQKGVDMICRFGLLQIILFLVSGSLLSIGCSSNSSDFETYMQTPLPSNVEIIKMDGNWGNDPWRCWEISPVDDELKRKLIAKWNLVPNSRAFHGVASGGKTYCEYEGLSESYSGDSDSYRAVGINTKLNKMVVYFYNG
jgi:hypothetical protein